MAHYQRLDAPSLDLRGMTSTARCDTVRWRDVISRHALTVHVLAGEEWEGGQCGVVSRPRRYMPTQSISLVLSIAFIRVSISILLTIVAIFRAYNLKFSGYP